MRLASVSAGLLLSMFACLAHAEGNYNSMNMAFLLYAAAAAAVMGIQGLYTLSLSGATIGTRIAWVMLLFFVDAVILMALLQAEVESPFPYIASVIPGFIAVFIFKKAAADNIPDNKRTPAP